MNLKQKRRRQRDDGDAIRGSGPDVTPPTLPPTLPLGPPPEPPRAQST